MIQFFASIFIKNRQDYSSPAVRQAYGTLCGAVAVSYTHLDVYKRQVKADP